LVSLSLSFKNLLLNFQIKIEKWKALERGLFYLLLKVFAK
jgi:hypothetical protein